MADAYKPKHVFVLMLENRSFDHLFGFSGLRGTDAETGAPTGVVGLAGTEANTYPGPALPGGARRRLRDARRPAPRVRGRAPPALRRGRHLRQGPAVPDRHQLGLRRQLRTLRRRRRAGRDHEVLRHAEGSCLILHALAQMYAVCDHWFSSMPGPTWPNRMFLHAASSGGLDHSTTTPGNPPVGRHRRLHLPGRHNLRLAPATPGKGYRIYSGEGQFPMVAALKGISDLAKVQERGEPRRPEMKDPGFPLQLRVHRAELLRARRASARAAASIRPWPTSGTARS